MMNPMGTKGNLAQAFANILRDMWQGESQCLMPVTFRVSELMTTHIIDFHHIDSGLSAPMLRNSAAPSNTIRRSSSTSFWTGCTKT